MTVFKNVAEWESATGGLSQLHASMDPTVPFELCDGATNFIGSIPSDLAEDEWAMIGVMSILQRVGIETSWRKEAPLFAKPFVLLDFIWDRYAQLECARQKSKGRAKKKTKRAAKK